MLLSVIAVTPLYYPLLLQCHTPLHIGVQGMLLVVTPKRAGIVIYNQVARCKSKAYDYLTITI